MTALALEALTKRFGAETVVDEVSLALPSGGLTALLGPSGCGKTTLLRMIAGLESPSAGRISFDGADVTDVPAHLRHCGMVFQSFALFPHLNVADNVAYALAIAGAPKAQRRTRAEELLELVRLGGYGGRRVGELSGGQRQRVAVARALAQDPRVFLLDEPMSALDAKLREEMQVELRLLQQRLGITTVVVTHDQREAMTMAETIVVLEEGRVVQAGSPQEVYHKPATRFVAEFIGKANILEGTVRGGRIETAALSLVADPPARFIDGAPVTVACRPEWMGLQAASPCGDGANRVKGTVTFVRDIGQIREVHVGIDDHTLVCEVSFADPSRYQEGEMVTVELPPSALRIFPRPDRPAPPAPSRASR